MADPGGGSNGAGLVAALTALVAASGAALAAASPKLLAALQARHTARIERVEAERKLLRERAAYAEALGDLDEWGPEHPVCRLLDGCRDALAVANEESYAWANPAFCSVLGFEPGDLAGEPWGPRVAPGSVESVQRARDRVMGGRAIERLRLKMVRKQGETISVVAHSTPGPGAQLVRLEMGR